MRLPEHPAAAPVLWILLIGQIANAVTGPVAFTLIMTGKEGLFAQANTVGAVLNVIGCLTIIPRYGALGAAAVTAVTSSITKVLMLVWVVRRVLQ